MFERELISFLIPSIINPQFLFSVKIKVQLPPGKQSIDSPDVKILYEILYENVLCVS